MGGRSVCCVPPLNPPPGLAGASRAGTNVRHVESLSVKAKVAF